MTLSRLLVCLLLVAILTGCSASSAFRPYPAQIEPLRKDLARGGSIDADDLYKRQVKGNDGILYLLERGRAGQLAGEADESRKDLAKAVERIDEYDERAVISARTVGGQTASLALNDNVIPYQPPYFERAMLRYYQALDRLLDGQSEGALIDLRWAAEDQQAAVKNISEKRSRTRDVDLSGVKEQYAGLDEAAGAVRASYQNPAIFYLSGLTYETERLPNDAYIDYKKALELVPANTFLQRDALTLASRLQMHDDLGELKNRFGRVGSGPLCAPDSGDLVILFEDGLVPLKIPVDLVLPVPGSGLVRVSLPAYPADRTRFPRIDVETGDGRRLGRLEPLADLNGLAQRSLLEELPEIATRQILRAAAKATAAHEVRERSGPLAEILMTLYNLVSEQADLRAWSTLPATIQNLRSCVSPGKTDLLLTADDGWARNFPVEIRQKALTLLVITRIGTAIYARSVIYPLHQF